jgi:hypothetical protein
MSRSYGIYWKYWDKGQITYWEQFATVAASDISTKHSLLRQRKTLEERGLLDRVAVEIHPNPENSCFLFDHLGLRTSAEIDWAYSEAIEFTNLLAERTQAAGFMKGLMLQRICSSVASGISTARKLLDKETLEEIEDNRLLSELEALTQVEKWHLEKLIQHLSKKPEDPKFEAVVHYLLERDWLTLGCIIFSQYYNFAEQRLLLLFKLSNLFYIVENRLAQFF